LILSISGYNARAVHRLPGLLPNAQGFVVWRVVAERLKGVDLI
jgi:hypothetical protein